MRRFLVLAFAVAATFSVLANNFIPVSAPTAEGEFAYRPAGPNGAARLSEISVPTVSAPVPNAPAQPAAVAAAPPDITEAQVHTVELRPEVIDHFPATSMASENAFVHAQAFRPSVNLLTQRMSPIPVANIMPVALASTFQEHTSAKSLDAVVAERLNMAPDSAAIRNLTSVTAETRFIPLTTGATNIFAEIASRPLLQRPEIVPNADKLVDEGSIHFGNATAIESEERSSFDAGTPRDPGSTAAVFVKAAYTSPESIFHRPRYVVEPYAPASQIALTAEENTHVAISAQADYLAARPLADADAVVLPNVAEEPSLLTMLSEVPSAVFQRIGLLDIPEAPAESESLAIKGEDHIATILSTPIETERSTVLADAATLPIAQSPVLISASTAMNASILKPMSAGPLVDAPMLNENAIASHGSYATPFDRMIDTPDVPEAVVKARPVTISAKTEFSGDLLKPMNAPINPFVKLDNAEILSAIQQARNYCDPNFVGEPIRFSQTVELKLDDLLRQVHQRFGVNFIVGKGVANLPMNIKAGSIPWNVLLRSQLFISGVRARCIDQNTIELVENQELPRLQDGADVETRFVKLKFLQRTSSGSVDLAGRGQGGGGGQNGQGGGCSAGGGQGGGISGGGGGGGGGSQQSETAATQSSSKFDKLIIEIEKILGLRSMTESSGGQGGQGGGQGQTATTEPIRTNRFVTQIPGRNILTIRATKEEHELIEQIIVRADRPPFQVVVKGLVYTANQDKLRDIGVRTNIFGGTADGRTTGEVTGHTLGGGGTIFDFSTIIGTFDFNVQASALEQSGVLSVKSRPFSTVIDGLCARLNVGRSIPIIIDSSLGGQGALEFIDALNKLDVTPHVIDDENGNPVAVTLELTMFANDVDNSVIARGVPAVSERSIQTQLLLAEDKTAILGGFTVDQDSRSVSKTPGLGDIPIIGELFKRRVNDKRVNRLYFAISVDVIPYPEAIRPVDVPGANTDIPSITPEQKKRADIAEPKQVKGP